MNQIQLNRPNAPLETINLTQVKPNVFQQILVTTFIIKYVDPTPTSVNYNTLKLEIENGNYQPDEGEQECLAASPGNFVNSPGSPSQMPCEPGTYQPDEAMTSCQQADPGHYVPESGSISQQVCPTGSTQEEAGQSDCIKKPSLILLIITYASPIIFIGIMAILYIKNREKKQPKTRKRSYIYSEDVRSRK